jgi:hypothetical protein
LGRLIEVDVGLSAVAAGVIDLEGAFVIIELHDAAGAAVGPEGTLD